MSRSYRKEIISVLLQNSTTVNLDEIDFEWLADKAGLKVAQIEADFKDIPDVFYHAAVAVYRKHEQKSQKIVKLQGVNAFETLIRHDMARVYIYVRHIPDAERLYPKSKSTQHIKEYIATTMPKYYFDLLRLNPELIPDTNMDIRIYAQFIVHSMFFCVSSINDMKTMNPEEFKAPTRKIISSLFRPKTKAV